MSESLTIGSSPLCDVQVDDEWMSGFHARLGRDAAGRFYVEDLGSMNGTWIQRAGQPDPAHPARLPRVREPTLLQPGDRIWLSRYSVLAWDGAGQFSVLR